MLHYGSKEITRATLNSLKPKLDAHQLILLNNSHEDISSLAAIIPNTILLDHRENIGFARGVNLGIAASLKDKSITHVFLMNNDLTIASGNFDILLRTFQSKSSAAIVSPILHHVGGYDWGGKYNRWTGMVKHTNWDNKPKTIISVSHVAGAAMLIPREVLVKVGLFDERFFLYYEDLDFCLRVREAGYTIHINPEVVGEHLVSSGSNLIARSMREWRSHLLFLFKYLPVKVYPTALIWDSVFYPLILLKSIIGL